MGGERERRRRSGTLVAKIASVEAKMKPVPRRTIVGLWARSA
jgi:hypothetical protein